MSRAPTTRTDPLKEYNAKRDFKKTAEPAGKRAAASESKEGGRLVVQKHDATRLHWDLRLEAGRSLKDQAPIPISSGLRCRPRTTRCPMATSKARSPRASTAAAP